MATPAPMDMEMFHDETNWWPSPSPWNMGYDGYSPSPSPWSWSPSPSPMGYEGYSPSPAGVESGPGWTESGPPGNKRRAQWTESGPGYDGYSPSPSPWNMGYDGYMYSPSPAPVFAGVGDDFKGYHPLWDECNPQPFCAANSEGCPVTCWPGAVSCKVHPMWEGGPVEHHCYEKWDLFGEEIQEDGFCPQHLQPTSCMPHEQKCWKDPVWFTMTKPEGPKGCMDDMENPNACMPEEFCFPDDMSCPVSCPCHPTWECNEDYTECGEVECTKEDEFCMEVCEWKEVKTEEPTMPPMDMGYGGYGGNDWSPSPSPYSWEMPEWECVPRNVKAHCESTCNDPDGNQFCSWEACPTTTTTSSTTPFYMPACRRACRIICRCRRPICMAPRRCLTTHGTITSTTTRLRRPPTTWATTATRSPPPAPALCPSARFRGRHERFRAAIRAATQRTSSRACPFSQASFRPVSAAARFRRKTSTPRSPLGAKGAARALTMASFFYAVCVPGVSTSAFLVTAYSLQHTVSFFILVPEKIRLVFAFSSLGLKASLRKWIRVKPELSPRKFLEGHTLGHGAQQCTYHRAAILLLFVLWRTETPPGDFGVEGAVS